MLKKVVNGDFLKRLDNIIQWQEKDVFTKESVSSHSYKVSVFCSVLLDTIFGDDKDFDGFKVKCLNHAIFHDWDEALLLRDISHETKYNLYNGDEIRSALDKLSEHLCKEEFGESGVISESIKVEDVAVKRLVKFCDWLALAFFIRREKQMGNKGLENSVTIVNNGLEKSLNDLMTIGVLSTQEDYGQLYNVIKGVFYEG